MLCSHCLGLDFYGQLLEQRNFASLSRRTAFLQYNASITHCYCYTLGKWIMMTMNDSENLKRTIAYCIDFSDFLKVFSF